MSLSTRPSTVSYLISSASVYGLQPEPTLSGCRAEVDEEGVPDRDGQGKEWKGAEAVAEVQACVLEYTGEVGCGH